MPFILKGCFELQSGEFGIMPLGDFDIRIVENGHAPSALALETQTRQCNALFGILRFFLGETKQKPSHETEK